MYNIYDCMLNKMSIAIGGGCKYMEKFYKFHLFCATNPNTYINFILHRPQINNKSSATNMYHNLIVCVNHIHVHIFMILNKWYPFMFIIFCYIEVKA
jgi:hypothetical protein